MGVLLKNNATSRLSSSLTAGATTLSVTSGDGAKFPSPTDGQWFPLTVIKASGTLEIMRCTARSGDLLTVVRAQEGTAAQAFTAGDRVELRLTSGALAEFKQTDTISAFMQGMLDDANAEEARNTLGLGTAATRNAQVSPTDATANALMAVGAAGLLGAAEDIGSVSWNTLGGVSRMVRGDLAATTDGPFTAAYWLVGWYQALDKNDLDGIFYGAIVTAETPRVFTRSRTSGSWGGWVELIHTGNIHPVGSHYIQFAESDGTFSAAKSPATLFGGTWTLKFNTDSVFFRTEGSLASAGRLAGIQGDAIRNIYGEFAAIGGGGVNALGAIRANPIPYTQIQAGVVSGTSTGFILDASQIVPTAYENRVTNRLIRVWERTA